MSVEEVCTVAEAQHEEMFHPTALRVILEYFHDIS